MDSGTPVSTVPIENFPADDPTAYRRERVEKAEVREINHRLAMASPAPDEAPAPRSTDRGVTADKAQAAEEARKTRVGAGAFREGTTDPA